MESNETINQAYFSNYESDLLQLYSSCNISRFHGVVVKLRNSLTEKERVTNMQNLYRQHLQRVRESMVLNQVDIMFLGFGREFTYLTGTSTPPVYPDLRVWGDWIAGIIFSVDQDPVLVLHDDHGDKLNLKPLYNVVETIQMGIDDPDPDATLNKGISPFIRWKNHCHHKKTVGSDSPGPPGSCAKFTLCDHGRPGF